MLASGGALGDMFWVISGLGAGGAVVAINVLNHAARRKAAINADRVRTVRALAVRRQAELHREAVVVASATARSA